MSWERAGHWQVALHGYRGQHKARQALLVDNVYREAMIAERDLSVRQHAGHPWLLRGGHGRQKGQNGGRGRQGDLKDGGESRLGCGMRRWDRLTRALLGWLLEGGLRRKKRLCLGLGQGGVRRRHRRLLLGRRLFGFGDGRCEGFGERFGLPGRGLGLCLGDGERGLGKLCGCGVASGGDAFGDEERLSLLGYSVFGLWTQFGVWGARRPLRLPLGEPGLAGV